MHQALIGFSCGETVFDYFVWGSWKLLVFFVFFILFFFYPIERSVWGARDTYFVLPLFLNRCTKYVWHWWNDYNRYCVKCTRIVLFENGKIHVRQLISFPVLAGFRPQNHLQVVHPSSGIPMRPNCWKPVLIFWWSSNFSPKCWFLWRIALIFFC